MNQHAKRKSVMILLSALLLCTASVMMLVKHADRIMAISSAAPDPTLIIDAGHGGIDGGAISKDGTKESDINLAIALRLESLARFCGRETRMTRWDDSRKTDIVSYSEREDLKERTALVNQTSDAVLISIHQNDFPTDQPRGAQVLYSAFGGSENLARQIQKGLITQLDPENRRQAVPSPSELYMMSNTRCPAVLVECGFMSNNFEVLKLKEPRYQTSIAVVIAASYLAYLNLGGEA